MYLKLAKERFYKYSKNCNNDYGQELYINPLLWQFGHVIFFYINHVLENLNIKDDNVEKYKKYINFYDSFLTPLELRKGKQLINYNELIKLSDLVFRLLYEYCNNKNSLTNTDCYLLMLGILHNEMHNEAFLFTKLNLKKQIDFKINVQSFDNIIEDIEFINYSGGNFKQGTNEIKEFLTFDNEMPQFETYVHSFSISKYTITEHQFLQFVKNDGYKKKEYWSNNGYHWKEKCNINLPLYWIKEESNYFKMLNKKKYSLISNLPMSNISYYEAEAYCSWKNCRLPTETEWEYTATNEGKTNFPWGNKKEESVCNINYKSYIKNVDCFKKGNNKKGVSQLIGNVWEWCLEPIYPYNRFEMDLVYREMSYPFFGFKKICKGGSFAVPDHLIHTRYRNAQYPDCRIQFIGFRVCKKN